MSNIWLMFALDSIALVGYGYGICGPLLSTVGCVV